MTPRPLTTYRWDVFLSHNTKDKPQVRRLAERLRGDGLRVWLDAWEIQPGDPIPSRIMAGLEGSRVLLMLLSKRKKGPSEYYKKFADFVDSGQDRLVLTFVDGEMVGMARTNRLWWTRCAGSTRSLHGLAIECKIAAPP